MSSYWGYNNIVEYNRGREKRATRALSRVKHVVNSLIVNTVRPGWIANVVKSYKNDKLCTVIISELAINANNKPNFKFHHGILRYKNIIVVGSSTNLTQVLIQAFHTSKLGWPF